MLLKPYFSSYKKFKTRGIIAIGNISALDPRYVNIMFT